MIEFSLIDALTKERLKAIEERTTAGSVGAWITPVNAKSLVFDGEKLLVARCELDADALFIANARQDVTWLIAQLRESEQQRMAMQAAICASLADEHMQRPHLEQCKTCKRRLVDSKQRKYKYGCSSICKDAVALLSSIGVVGLEGLLPYAGDYEPVEQEETEHADD